MIGLCRFNDKAELTAIAFHPVSIGATATQEHDRLEDRLMPRLAHGLDAERILKRFQKQSQLYGSDIKIAGDAAEFVFEDAFDRLP